MLDLKGQPIIQGNVRQYMHPFVLSQKQIKLVDELRNYTVFNHKIGQQKIESITFVFNTKFQTFLIKVLETVLLLQYNYYKILPKILLS